MKQFLSPKDFAAALGVSESTVRRWVDSGAINVSRTTGGHRRIDLSDAIGFIRESGMPVRKPHLLGLADLAGAPDLSRRTDDPTQLLGDALEQGDAVQVRAMLVSMYLAGHSVAELCDGLIAPAMHKIGTFWEHRDDGIMIEHRATDICIAALNQLRTLLPTPTADALVALGGALPDDPYLLPSLMAATVVAVEGWRVTNLGPRSPADVLIAAAQTSGAQLVWLSVSVEESADDVMRHATRIADELHDDGVSVVVGGRALPQPFKRNRPNLHEARSMTELAAFARGLGTSRSATPAMRRQDGTAV
jgi:excisionase family DNA binding protein